MNLEAVINAVQEQRGRYREICDRAGVSYPWLTKLATGQIREPGINKMQRLQAALQDMQAEAAES